MLNVSIININTFASRGTYLCVHICMVYRVPNGVLGSMELWYASMEVCEHHYIITIALAQISDSKKTIKIANHTA